MARVAHLVGAKVAVTAGFVLLAVGLLTGAVTSTASSGPFVGGPSASPSSAAC